MTRSAIVIMERMRVRATGRRPSLSSVWARSSILRTFVQDAGRRESVDCTWNLSFLPASRKEAKYLLKLSIKIKYLSRILTWNTYRTWIWNILYEIWLEGALRHGRGVPLPTPIPVWDLVWFRVLKKRASYEACNIINAVGLTFEDFHAAAISMFTFTTTLRNAF